MSFLTKIFGSRNERILRRLRKQVAKINKMEPAFEALSDDELRAKTEEFRSRLANGETFSVNTIVDYRRISDWLSDIGLELSAGTELTAFDNQ